MGHARNSSFSRDHFGILASSGGRRGNESVVGPIRVGVRCADVSLYSQLVLAAEETVGQGDAWITDEQGLILLVCSASEIAEAPQTFERVAVERLGTARTDSRLDCVLLANPLEDFEPHPIRNVGVLCSHIGLVDAIGAA